MNGACSYNGPLIECNIQQVYPNCPKYIQRRAMVMPEHFQRVNPTMSEGTTLTAGIINQIKNADTLFVASAGANGDLDVSHRGGNPGFVQIVDQQVLKIPDYPGNSLFNTFGNISQNPNVGLLFVDFGKRQTLQLTGTASLLFDQTSDIDLQLTKGTGRYWLFSMTRWLETIDHHHLQWNFLEYSHFNP